MRGYVSLLITRLISSIKLTTDGEHCSVKQDDRHAAVMRFLQNLVWRYVITSPRLATQQAGQRKIIRDLFEVYCQAIKDNDRSILPASFRADLDPGQIDCMSESPERLAIDIVASLSESQAVLLHRRFLGVASGSFTDIVDV